MMMMMLLLLIMMLSMIMMKMLMKLMVLMTVMIMSPHLSQQFGSTPLAKPSLTIMSLPSKQAERNSPSL